MSPEDIRYWLSRGGLEPVRYDEHEMDVLHQKLDGLGIPRADSHDAILSAWGRVRIALAETQRSSSEATDQMNKDQQ